jgi:bacterioferritin-associated ferredoxin
MILNFLDIDSQFYYKYADKPSRDKTGDRRMLVCLCKGVSDKKIRWLVQNGATCLRDVMATCKAGSDCGSCVCQVRDLIEEVRLEGEGASAKKDPAVG